MAGQAAVSVSSATAEPQQTGLPVGKTAVTHLYVPVNILPVAWVVQHSQEVLQSAQLSAHNIVFSYNTPHSPVS